MWLKLSANATEFETDEGWVSIVAKNHYSYHIANMKTISKLFPAIKEYNIIATDITMTAWFYKNILKNLPKGIKVLVNGLVFPLYKEQKGYLFNVPNTAEGEMFLSMVNKFLNKDTYSFRRHGRAKNRKAIAERNGLTYTPSEVKIEDSDYWGLYLQKKPAKRIN